MIVETGLIFEDGMSYVDILGEIRKKLEENDTAIKQRDKLKDGIKQFQKMKRKVVFDLDKAKQMERDLLRQFNVKLPEELRELHKRHQKHRRLLQQEQGVQRELEASLANFCPETTIGNLLEPRIARKMLEQKAEAELEKQLEAGNENFEYQDETLAEELSQLEELPSLDDLLKGVIKRIETASAKLHDELEQRGQLAEQLRQIAEDQTAIKTQRELAILDDKIRHAKLEWQTYSVCARMLDEIRSTYERDRQPRTLAEASELLKRLTDGKYHRIWTPLGEETLLVDDGNGQTFDVAWLSRGTREQLFIALRLALASAFAQHGSILPLILDDVLVNFDSQRAFAAAKVLLEFAKSGRQILLFTCHEHVCKMFQKLDVPVRILPAVDDPGKPTKVLLPRSILKRREAKRRREIQHLAEIRAKERIEQEINDREEQIRLDAVRKAEVQRLILQMQQQATAEKTVAP
jgi:DNA repair exonuclease SbcCD ATPase subunit